MRIRTQRVWLPVRTGPPGMGAARTPLGYLVRAPARGET